MSTNAPTAPNLPPLHPNNPVRTTLTTIAWIALAVIVYYSFCAVEFDMAKLVGGVPNMTRFIQDAFPPDWSVLPDVFRETVLTIQIALIATIISAIISLPMAFWAAMDLSRSTMTARIFLEPLKWFSRFFFNLTRSIDTLIFALIFVFAVGIGPFPGMLALAIHSVGMLGKLFHEVIDSIDQGPVEALQAVGAGRLAVKRWGVLPQVMPLFISYFIYRFEINIRVAVVLGLVGAGGIGFLLNTYMGLFQFKKVSVVVLSILVLVLTLDYLTTWLRKRVA